MGRLMVLGLGNKCPFGCRDLVYFLFVRYV